MSPGAHLLASWFLANRPGATPRERRLVTLAGVVPDLDGLGVVVDVATRGRTDWFGAFHHQVGHTLLAGLLLAGLAALAVPARRLRTALWALGAFHLHLLCDLVGSRGPDGYRWPIPYLHPFAPGPGLTWAGQWPLNGWQNLAILAALLAGAAWQAARQRRSFIEVISRPLDRAIFEAAARRWPA